MNDEKPPVFSEIENMHLYVYKPLYDRAGSWLLREDDKNGNISYSSWKYKEYFLHIMNSYKLMTSEHVREIVCNLGIVSKDELPDMLDDKNKWCESFEELLYYIDTTNSSVTLSEKLEIYNKYKYFGYYLFRQDYDSFEYFSVNKSERAKYEGIIRYLGAGTVIDENNDEILCDVYDVRLECFLFALDLFEVMFNPDDSFGFRECPICNRYFILNRSAGRNAKYCTHCRAEKKNIKKIQYDNYVNQRPIRIRKNIINLLTEPNNYDEDELQSFKYESHFYSCAVHGKKVKNSKYYSFSKFKFKEYRKDIKTKDQYISWLEEKYKEYKEKRKKGSR